MTLVEPVIFRNTSNELLAQLNMTAVSRNSLVLFCSTVNNLITGEI